MSDEKKVDTWMPFLVDKYLGDTTHLSTEQHGAYMLLLLTMWKRDGELPNDDEQLLNITRLLPERFEASKKTLRAFFDVDGDVLRQKRLTAELVRAKVNQEQKSAAGKASAAKRKAAREANGKATGVATDVATSNATDAQRLGIPTPTPLPLPSGASEANASAVPAGGSPEPETQDAAAMTKQELWRAGKSLLAEQDMPKAQCGTFVGKLVNDYGEEIVVEAVRSTVVARPADAASYLKATCMRLKGERKSPVTVEHNPQIASTQALFADMDAAKERAKTSTVPESLLALKPRKAPPEAQAA